MKVFEFIILFFLFLLICIGVYFFWFNLNSNNESYAPYVGNLSSIPISSAGAQFYSNMRFPDKEISYEVESACNMQKRREINEAFAILSEKTILRFHLLENEAQIKILCSEIPKEKQNEEEKNYFIAGEGGPTAAINLSNGYYLILSGKVSFFRTEKCNETKLALHEILHVLGFDHSGNQKSIMYPVTSCEQYLDSYIIDELNRLYAIPSLPDLAIEKISANKTSYGLSFSISVANSGFSEAQNSQLDIYSEGNKITEYDFGLIKPGMKKMLDVQNAKLPRKTGSLLFVVSSDKKDELSLGNNKAEVFLEGSNL
ncbi:MAG: matrixin family metalloprotease [Nanoarchaeota archaeon]